MKKQETGIGVGTRRAQALQLLVSEPRQGENGHVVWHCGVCGLWISSAPLTPQEHEQLEAGVCEECGEPMAEALTCGSGVNLSG